MNDEKFLELVRRAERGDQEAAAALPMSEWAEARRAHMTPQTIAANARLHRGDMQADPRPNAQIVRELPQFTVFENRNRTYVKIDEHALVIDSAPIDGFMAYFEAERFDLFGGEIRVIARPEEV